jgi:4'-phosphopantetheinyl transferase
MSHIRITEFTEAHFVSDSPLVLADGEVHLWQVFTQTFQSRGPKLNQLLSGEESDQLKRFYFEKDRTRFAVAHGTLRILAGRYLNIPPRLVNFRKQSNGKPELAEYRTAESFSFNLSHSHQLVVLAFSRYPNLGVDVEYIRPMPDFQQIADCYFHENERAAFQSVPLCKREKAFFDYWTRKEAFVKATGEGLSRPLNSFFTSIGSVKQGGMLGIGGERIITADWNLLSFTPAWDYTGAVAFEARTSLLKESGHLMGKVPAGGTNRQ